MKFALIFHIGAGYQSLKKESNYLDLCTSIIEKFKFLTRNPISIYDLASFLIDGIENSELTNAGYGSNLTQNGFIECESSAMESTSLRFSALGCLRRVKNPGTAAIRFLEAQIERPISSIGRVFPTFLVSHGAENFLERDLNLKLTDESELISVAAKNYWKKYSKIIDEKEENFSAPLAKRQRNDTIGLVLLSDDGKIITISSSGGIALKREGRIGHSCVYGAGMWAEKNIGLVTSGTGEQIIRTSFARILNQRLSEENLSDALKNSLKQDFLESNFLANESSQKYVGVVGLRHDNKFNCLELFCAHTTLSMGYGFCIEKSKGCYISDALISRKSKERDVAVSVTASKFQ